MNLIIYDECEDGIERSVTRITAIENTVSSDF